MTLDAFGNRARTDPAVVRRIKEWSRAALALGDDAALMVAELRCTEPGCPPVETVVAVLEGGDRNRQFKIHKPAQEVTAADVAAASATRGCASPSHDHP